MNAHARKLRTAKETTSNAIAKMKAMRAHTHGFAELMLPHVASDEAPDHIACWTSFSGLLDNDAIGSANWAAKKKKPSASLAAVCNIAKFDQFTSSAMMNSPAPDVAYHLTAAKAKAPEILIDYEPLGPVTPIKAAFKGKGKGSAKRKHVEIDEDKDKDEEEMDGSEMAVPKGPTFSFLNYWTATAAPGRYRTEKSVSYEWWPFEPPSRVSRPPPCGSTGSCANRTRRTDLHLHLRVCADGDL